MIFFALADYKSHGNDKCKNLRNRHCPPNSVYAENDWQYQNANAFEKQCAQKRNEGGNRAVIERSKNAEAKILNPASKNEQEKILKARTVSS